MTQQFKDILTAVNPMLLEDESVNLIEEGIVDSLAIFKLIAAFEKTYGISLSVDDISHENFASAQSIWNLVERLKRDSSSMSQDA